MTNQPIPGLPETTAKAWRLWLLTGSRRERIDRRRLRGAHLGLKRVLGADMLVRGEPPYGWKEFSDAMLRQAIGDAMRTLPETDGRMLKLAYFGGYSNRQIALESGLSEAAVATRLRRALDIVADRIHRSGAAARRVAYAIAAWFCGHACEAPLQHALQASVVAVAAAAVFVVAAGPAPATVPGHAAEPPTVRALVVRSDVTTAARHDAHAGPGEATPATPTSVAPVAAVPVPELLPAAPIAAPPVLAVTPPPVALPKAPPLPKAAPQLPQLPLGA